MSPVSGGSFTNSDKYRWIKYNGKWLIERTTENGVKTLLPEGVIPSRAQCRFGEPPDYRKWKERQEKKFGGEPDADIAAR